MSSIPIPAAWSRIGEASIPVSTTRELQSRWRRLDDPLLDQLIAAAIKAAPDLRTAQAKLRQARASRDRAVGNLYPSLGVSVSANRSKTGTADARAQYAAGFDASWEPSIFGGKRDAAVGAQADVAACEATLAAARVLLAAEVALEYVMLRVHPCKQGRRSPCRQRRLLSNALTEQFAGRFSLGQSAPSASHRPAPHARRRSAPARQP